MTVSCSVSSKYRNRGIEDQDLVSEGVIGLIRGIEKFNPERGFKLSTYATWWIRQAVSRAVADTASTIRVPVHIQSIVKAYEATAGALNQSLGRPATPEEIAAKMHITPNKTKDIQSAIAARDMRSLDAQVGTSDDSGVLGDLVADRSAGWADRDPSQAANKFAQHDATEKLLRDAGLSERERVVFVARKGDLKPDTLEKIGLKFDVTRERIRQIESTAIGKLRAYLMQNPDLADDLSELFA